MVLFVIQNIIGITSWIIYFQNNQKTRWNMQYLFDIYIINQFKFKAHEYYI